MYKTTAIAVLLAAWCCTAQAAPETVSGRPETVSGRYVNVSIPGREKILSLAEVQVYSAGKNVAQGKKTRQTSLGSDGIPSRAVDGNTNGDWAGGSITHTAEVTNDPAWEVDLGKSVAIEKVVIFNRDGYEGRLHGCRVTVLDEKRKTVWGVDIPKPGRGATELAVKSHPTPEWAGKTVAKISSRGANGSVQVTSNTSESLRRAIDDLIATFGNRYPKGKEYLARLDAIADDDTERLEKLCSEALLENPLLDFEKLLLIKRRGNLGLPQNWQGNCVMRGSYDNEIAVLSPVRPDGKLTTIYRPENKSFVGDVDLHWDARKMLISQKGDNNRYEVFELDVDGSGLRQVTPSEPDIDNYDACYLADDRIIYDSTACFQGVPCVGGNDQVANLHIINPDGTGIRRLCFDQDHDWCPTMMNDGRVMFTRWEYSDTPHYFTRVVMRMNPDGTGQTALYGSNSLWPNSTFYARPIPGHPSKFVAIISGHHGVARMGELIVFDPALGQREADGVVQRIPGYGQKVEPIIRDQLVNNSWPKFLHPFPLSEKYFITACQLNQQSPWGVYLVDVFDNIVPICVEPGVAMLEPLPLRTTKRPSVIPDKVDTSRTDAFVYINDVHVGNGLKGVPRGTVKRLRLFAFDYGYQNLANHTYIGIEGPWDVHRIVGTVEVESDGSAAFRVPANTPLAVQPLDKDGKALQLMRSWFVAMPGENLSCVGCHEDTIDAPPTRPTLATKKAPQEITPWFGPARGFSFDREVQPMLDKYCVGCHSDVPYKGQQLTDLRQDDVRTFSRAYKALQQHVRRPGPESDYHMFPAAEYYADTSGAMGA